MSRWEGDTFLASSEIPHILLNQLFHCRIQKRAPLAHIQSKVNLFYTVLSYSLKLRFNIIIPSMPSSRILKLK